MIFLIISASQIPCTANTIVVDKDHGQGSIKEAVANAVPFDTILVEDGIYKEHSIFIDKPLYLSGSGVAVIDAESKGNEIFIITADFVVIDGFILTGVGVSFLKELSAVKVRKSGFGIIRNNTIRNCFFAIYLEYGNNYIIENNIIDGWAVDEASAGNAIHIWKGSKIEVLNNIAKGHRDGIYFEFVDSSNIQGNLSQNNLRYGLHFMFSDNDVYSNNIFEDNGAGVAVMFSDNIIMDDNEFSINRGGASYGLLLKEITDSRIKDNDFYKNTIGILAEGVSRNIIERNQFTMNGTALDIKGNCIDNIITNNNFLSNTFELVTNSRYSNNQYIKNYWSNYTGYDLNRDGFGDEAYRPVNLFALIADKIPAATILLHSLFVKIIVAGERIFPEITPEKLVDEYPRMTPFSYDRN